MSKQAKVSILVPIYNVEKYLHECIDSILNQTLQDIEIILINDGSTDNSPAICEEYAKKDKRVKAINKANSGYGHSMNMGLDTASGEYIGIVESDDYIRPDMYEKQYKLAKKLNLDILKADFRKFYGDGNERTFEYMPVAAPHFYNRVLKASDDVTVFKQTNNVIWTGLYNARFLKENNIRFNETPGASYQDNGFFFQTYALAQRMYFINEDFYQLRRDNPNSSVKSKAKVFCMCDEYAFIRRFIDQNNLHEFVGIYYVLMYLNYMFTYYRVADEFKPMFLERFREDFLFGQKNKELDKTLFSKKEWENVRLLLKSTESFHNKYAGSNALVDKKPSLWKRLKNTVKQAFSKGNAASDSKKKYSKEEIERLYNYYAGLRREEYPQALAAWYKELSGKDLNLDAPVTFNEKIQWLKLYDSTPLKTRLADKYQVREWIKEKIGEKYLIPLLGVYDSFDKIDFSKLPQQFVIKCNHGSGWNIIVRDKNKLNLAKAKRKIDNWLKTDYAFVAGFELHYHNIAPKIIIEEFVTNDNQALYDYKFWCFNGEVKYMQFRDDYSANLKMAFYDLDWKKQNFCYDHPLYTKDLPKPENFDDMVKIAAQLCRGFAFVCVDLYRLNNGDIKFGEMTFTRTSGLGQWNDENINLKLGEMITLPAPSPIP